MRKRIVIAFVVLTVLLGYTNADSSLDYFLISDGTTLKITDNFFNQEVVLDAGTVITAISNRYDENYYWATNNSGLVRKNGLRNQSIHSQFKSSKINSIAVDYLNKKVYFIDELAANINILDEKNDHFSIILSDLRKPRNLALDSSMSLMFFSQADSAIYRANLDGSDLIKVIDKAGITTVTVDQTVEPRMLYWAVADGYIETSDYSGSKRMIVLGMPVTFSSLAVSNGSRLAWVSPATWTSRESKLYIYEDVAGSGRVRFKNTTLKDPRMIQHYVKNHSSDMPSHVCDDDNGGCQQLCLLGANKKPSCACKIGWQLQPETKTCWPIEKFVLYTQGRFVRGKSLESIKMEAFIDAIVPIKLSSYSSSNRVISFDYDLAADVFIYHDHARIYEVNVLDANQAPKIRDFGDFNPRLKSLTVDWASGNVYAINDSTIMVYNHRSSDASRKYKFLNITYRMDSIVVHPNRGYLYFTAAGDKKYAFQLYRINTDLDKSSMKIIYAQPPSRTLESNASIKYGIALDYEKNRLYHLHGKTVKHSNLDGKDLKSIDVSIVQDPRSIAIYSEWMYVANLTSIWRLHKLNGSNAVRFAPKYGESVHEPISGVQIYSGLLQNVDHEIHPCAVNNGDCEHFCFAVPIDNNDYELKKVCACHSNDLQSDGLSCF